MGMSDDVCGSEPPPVLRNNDGKEWTPGDCWCTLPPDHPEPLCLCQPCADRNGCPGWKTPPDTQGDTP